jgi:membrane protein YqaA with SNARE-associated domain
LPGRSQVAAPVPGFCSTHSARYHKGLLAKITAALVAFGPIGVLLLGFIDSAGVPVAMGMDALILLVGIKAPERAWFTAFLAVVGSMGGTMLLYYLARRGGQRFAERKGAAEPDGKPGRFREWFERYGLVTVFIPGMVPIPLPLKVFVISAGVLRTPALRFTVVILVARVVRYFGLAYLAVQLGDGAAGFVQRNAWTLVGVATALAAALFLLIRLSDRKPQAQV